MDYEAYKNTLPYPRAAHYTTTFYYKGGKTIARKVGEDVTLINDTHDNDLIGAVTERVTDNAALALAQRAYSAEEARLYELFKQDFFKELNIEKNSKREKLFSKCWDRGHASGYAEVLNVGYDLVELIED